MAPALRLHGAGWFDMVRPSWADGDDLRVVFENGTALLAGGRVVPCAIVQANNMLTQPAEGGGAAGEVVYDLTGRTPVEDLCHIASKLLALKAMPFEDPAMAHVSRYLADEQTRVFGLDVPQAVVPYPLKISSTWFDKALLRSGALQSQVIPLLVSDAHPGLVRPLPARFWPDEAAAPQVAAQQGEQSARKVGNEDEAQAPAKSSLLGRMFGRN